MTHDTIILIELAVIFLILWVSVFSIKGMASRIGEIYNMLHTLYGWENQDRLKALVEQNTETPEERKKRKQREASKRYKETHDRVMGLDGKYHYIKK